MKWSSQLFLEPPYGEAHLTILQKACNSLSLDSLIVSHMVQYVLKLARCCWKLWHGSLLSNFDFAICSTLTQFFFTFLMLTGHHESNWLKLINKKTGLQEQLLTHLILCFCNVSYMFHIIKCRLLESQLQCLTEEARRTCFPSHFESSQTTSQIASYFLFLTDPQLRKTFFWQMKKYSL